MASEQKMKDAAALNAAVVSATRGDAVMDDVAMTGAAINDAATKGDLFGAVDATIEHNKALRLQLADQVRRLVVTRGESDERIPGLHMSTLTKPITNHNCFYVLSVGLILRGSKRLYIGEHNYHYQEGEMLVTSLDLPTSYEIGDVSPTHPFVALSLRLNPGILAELIAATGNIHEDFTSGYAFAAASAELLEDFHRLLRLLDEPQQLPMRAPMLIRDIHYLALTSSAGAALRSVYAPGSAHMRLRQSIQWLRENFREDLSIEQLAEVAHMSPSTFHRQFKELTAITPIQYQKRLRLYEAQQFLLRGEGDVNSAAFSVGYVSPQQFNRDYKKFFGVTPGHSVKSLRQSMHEQFATANVSD